MQGTQKTRPLHPEKIVERELTRNLFTIFKQLPPHHDPVLSDRCNRNIFKLSSEIIRVSLET